MRKYLFTISLILTCTSLLVAQKTTTDYRGCTWGDSIEKIKQIEGTENANISDNQIAYSGKKLGKYGPASLCYYFDNNKLISIQWQVANIPYYDELLADLAGKYGEPDISTASLHRWNKGRTIIQISFKVSPSSFGPWTIYTLEYSDANYDSDNGL